MNSSTHDYLINAKKNESVDTHTSLIGIVKTFFLSSVHYYLDGHILELGLGFCYSITWWLASSYGYPDNNTKQEVSMGANDAAGLNHYKLFAMCIIWSIDTCRIIYDRQGAIPYRTKKKCTKTNRISRRFHRIYSSIWRPKYLDLNPRPL